MNSGLTPETKRSTEKERASLSIPECTRVANRYIKANGMCLFVMDVIGSRNFVDYKKFRSDFLCMVDDLNVIFDDFLPENNLTTHGRVEKGFNIILGDGITAAITDSEVIPLADEFLKTYYEHIPLRYSVAVDGYHRGRIALIK